MINNLEINGIKTGHYFENGTKRDQIEVNLGTILIKETIPQLTRCIVTIGAFTPKL